ncbi:MAG: hypothetical protein GY918_10010 [Gammaproteobacteria bacterium]|nr:hypothetical protein [Gammaproteobacteria bacterium]
MDSKVIIMRSNTFKNYVQLLRTTGAQLSYAIKAGRRYAVHNGVPILISDYIPVDSARTKSRQQTTTIWCCTLGYEDNRLFGVYPDNKGNNGLQIDKVSGGVDVDSTVHRVRWYVAVALAQSRGLAAIRGVAV